MAEKHQIDFKKDKKLGILIEWGLKVAVIQNGQKVKVSPFIKRNLEKNFENGEEIMKMVQKMGCESEEKVYQPSEVVKRKQFESKLQQF